MRDPAILDATLIRAHLDDLPFDSAQFDLVVCIEVLRYLPDPQPCINEMARVLRPGGLCLATAIPYANLNGYAIVNRVAVHTDGSGSHPRRGSTPRQPHAWIVNSRWPGSTGAAYTESTSARSTGSSGPCLSRSKFFLRAWEPIHQWLSRRPRARATSPTWSHPRRLARAES